MESYGRGNRDSREVEGGSVRDQDTDAKAYAGAP
jgi:hypothetical protein